MPLARSVSSNDIPALESIIQSSLTTASSKNIGHVQILTLEQTVGEAFTGGRSTPVFEIKCQVTTKAGIVKERLFIVKLIFMPTTAKEGGVDSSLRQKRESYAVERRFYEFIAPELRRVLAIPKLLASDHNGSQALPIACWLMTSLRVLYPSHPHVLDANSHMLYALNWLAQFHAYSWKTTTASDWRKHLWERGGFWNKKKKNDDGKLKSSWLNTCKWLSKNHPTYVTANTKSLATRLSALSEALSDFMLRQSKSSWSTMIHGDYKAANLFFKHRQEGNDINDDDERAAAAAIDFQYTGAGVPAEDVAYLLFPDAYINYWGEENSLLQYYYSTLMDCLMMSNKGGPSSLPWKAFCSLYKLSQVEMIIHWLSRGWVSSTIGDAKLVRALEETLDELDGGSAFEKKSQYINALEVMVESIE
eukprot:7935542-Ditylum_brightwellii.AAC.1